MSGSTWYSVDNYYVEILTVQVTRHTDSSIYVRRSNGKEERRARISGWVRYFPTYAEALSALRQQCRDRVTAAERTLGVARRELQAAELLPEEAPNA